MAVSLVGSFVDALVTQATSALASVKVYDGFGISEDPSDFLMVGVDDPDPQSAGTSTRTRRKQMVMTPTSSSYREESEVVCAAYSWNGDAVQKTARDAVFTIASAVDNLLRTTLVAGPTPSVLGVSGVRNAQITETDLRQDVWQAADALLVFTITFDALT